MHSSMEALGAPRIKQCSHLIQYLGESQRIKLALSTLNQIYWKCCTQGKLLVCNWNEELESICNVLRLMDTVY